MRDASFAATRREPYLDDPAPSRRGARGKRRPLGLLRVFGARRFGFSIVAGIAVLAAIGVPMNALFFQDGRHPAPLFARAPAPARTESARIESAKTESVKTESAKIETTKIENAKADAPVAARPPARRSPIEAAAVDAIAATLDGQRAPAKTEPVRPDPIRTGNVKPETKKPVAEKKRDPIGQLLGAGAAHEEGPDAGVLYAQRALLRLGYVVRADGQMGAATRQAIEKYERDSGLPATGKVTPALMKKLAAQSGVARQ